jgi:secreted trypsin-like serine protease
MSRSSPTPVLALLAVAALLSVAALGPGTAAAAPAATTSVVNGEGAVRGSFPYLAFVYFREGNEGEACSGTVVSSNVVLTAAHCVLDEARGVLRSAVGFKVVTGSVDWESSERVVSSVSAVAVDPEYAPSGESAHWADAAVLQLSRPIAAPPVRLAGSEAWAPGTAALIAGWGKLSPSQSGPSTALHYGTTAIQSAAYCASQASRFLAAGQLCVLDAAAPYDSVCNGDSGGPLVVVAPGTASEPLEIGIASYIVSESCAPSSPQYFTRADLVAPWVAAEVAAFAAPPGAAAEATVPALSAPALPRLGRGRAKRLARAALAKAFGASFHDGRGYSSDCEAIEAAKRACAVSWRNAAFRYAGRVTVFYALESNRVVWRYKTRVRRARAAMPAAGLARSRPAAGARGRSERRWRPRRPRSRSA